jgi:hypothetical protein
MPIVKQDGKIILNFGDGDIMIAPCAEIKSGELAYITIGIFKEGEKYPIDKSLPEFDGCVFENWSIKMYFRKKESVDSFIHVLEDFREKYNWKT